MAVGAGATAERMRRIGVLDHHRRNELKGQLRLTAFTKGLAAGRAGARAVTCTLTALEAGNVDDPRK